MNKVKCPHCGKQVELSEAIIHEFQEKIREEESKNLKIQFEKEKAVEKVEHEKRLRVQFEAENKERVKEIAEAKLQNKRLLDQLKDMNKTLSEFQEQQKKREDVIREKAEKDASDKARLEKLEFEKKISDMQKSLEDAQRKGRQGSQQLQGDVLELDLEQRLREAFPYDDFKPVPTGFRGGDIIQEIRNKFGNSAGFILWEAKRTKAWDKKWLTTLKDNMREISGSDCILVSEVLPSNVKMYDRIENVWVTSYEFAIKLASVVRFGLLNVAVARSSATHSDQQLRDLYRVITSDSFRQMFEARDEIITALRLEIEADKRGSEKRWKRQGEYINKLDRNNSQLYGELQAHIPTLKPLRGDSLELESGDEENEKAYS